MNVGGVKHDSGKAPIDLIPYEALEEIAKVLDFGAKKYARANWAKGIAISRLCAAALRHIFQFLAGENKDPESGLHPLAHAGCCLLFALWMIKRRPEMDDRWTNGLEGLRNGFDESAAKECGSNIRGDEQGCTIVTDIGKSSGGGCKSQILQCE